ncbi:Protein FAR-RED IMPAIRED RESPONSE 1 [Linum grandiflorum]
MIETIFWADARMQLDYHCFGDAISFDTTYRTNNEFRPLGLFVGPNHDRNLIVLGACLLYEETTEGFKWLFTTFLECMKGKKPKTIFTDQCSAIAARIRNVMPKIFHGLCTFHINVNAKNKFRKASQNDILKDLSHLMFGVDNEAEFDQHWDIMLQKHFTDKLPESHSWLTYIRKFRHQRSSTWVNNHFTAGMRSSQLSESCNSYLRGFLTSNNNLHQFFTQFNRTLEKKKCVEKQNDFSKGDRLHYKKIWL